MSDRVNQGCAGLNQDSAAQTLNWRSSCAAAVKRGQPSLLSMTIEDIRALFMFAWCTLGGNSDAQI